MAPAPAVRLRPAGTGRRRGRVLRPRRRDHRRRLPAVGTAPGDRTAMPSADAAAAARVDLADLGLDDGGHLLLDRALAGLAPGRRLTVTGRHPALPIHLGAWCRSHGHRLIAGQPAADPSLAAGALVVEK